MPISLKKVAGGGSIPVGGLILLNAFRGDKVDIDGNVYLRTGSIETNPANYDTEYFSDNIATAALPKYNSSTGLRTHNTLSKMKSFAGNGSNIVGVGTSLIDVAQACYTLDDGVNWINNTVGTGAVNSTLNSVEFGAGLFVAVSNNGKIFTSPTGATWTSRSSGTTNALNYVHWTGTAFIATGAGGTILRSTDGINWSTITSGTVKSILWVARDSTSGLIIATTSDDLLTSTNDGGSWTVVSAPLPTTYGVPIISSVAYAHGVWWVGASNGVYSSVNGTTGWVYANPVAMKNLRSVGSELFATGYTIRAYKIRATSEVQLTNASTAFFNFYGKCGDNYINAYDTASTSVISVLNSAVYAGSPDAIVVSDTFVASVAYYMRIK